MKITVPAGHSPALGLTGNYFKILNGSVERVRATFSFADGSHDEREVIAGVGFDFDKQFIDVMIESDVEADLELVALRGRVTDNRMSGKIDIGSIAPSRSVNFEKRLLPQGQQTNVAWSNESCRSLLIKNTGQSVVYVGSFSNPVDTVGRGMPLEAGQSISFSGKQGIACVSMDSDGEVRTLKELN